MARRESHTAQNLSYVPRELSESLHKPTTAEKTAAIKVMSTSQQVVSWVSSAAAFQEIDLKTTYGQQWFLKQCRVRAKRHIRQAYS